VLAQTHYAPLCKKVLQIKRTMSGSRRNCCLVKLEKEFDLSDESASVSEKSTASFVSSGTALWHPHVNAKSGRSSLVLLSLPLLSAFCHKLLIDSFVGDGKTFSCIGELEAVFVSSGCRVAFVFLASSTGVHVACARKRRYGA